jgi:hypothetical protein
MKTKHIIPVLIILLLGFQITLAQKDRPVRIEIPARSGSAPYNTIACGEQGMLLFYPTIAETGQDSINWSFSVLNTELKEVWRKQVAQREDVSFLKGIVRNKCIYLLFHDTRKDITENIIGIPEAKDHYRT